MICRFACLLIQRKSSCKYVKIAIGVDGKMSVKEKTENPPKLRDNSHLPRGKDFKPVENPTPKQLAFRKALREAMEALEREKKNK